METLLQAEAYFASPNEYDYAPHIFRYKRPDSMWHKLARLIRSRKLPKYLFLNYFLSRSMINAPRMPGIELARECIAQPICDVQIKIRQAAAEGVGFIFIHP